MAMRYRKRRNSPIVARGVQKRVIGKGTTLSILGLGISMCLAAISCLELMQESLADGVQRPSLVPLMLSILGFFLCAVCVALFQGLRYSNRIIGPTQRLCSIMRKVRAGDLTVRAHLRRGDYLRDLATELNALIDWLNEYPPPGSKTGGDLVNVDQDDWEDEDAELMSISEEHKGWR